MISLKIVRWWENQMQTLGLAHVMDEKKAVFDFKTLELPWKDNRPGVSCIPAGRYQVVKHHAPAFGACFWLPNVPGRTEILIHPGNYYTQIRGCILPGADFSDINRDGHRDVTQSRETIRRLLTILPDIFFLEIINR